MGASCRRDLLSKILAAISLAPLSAIGCSDRQLDVPQPASAKCELDTCTPELHEGETARMACVPAPAGGCAPCDDEDLREELERLIQDECAHFYEARRIECGPAISSDGSSCCYTVAAVRHNEGPCVGRPFIVEGRARTAMPGGAHGWVRALAPAVAGMGEGDRAALAEAWMHDGLAEHASVASFARHALELMSLGAPPELLAAVQQAAQDEIEHARLCFGLASAYGSVPTGPGPLALTNVEVRRDRVQIAVAIVREGCVGETLAAVQAAVARDACRDPVVADVLGRIADDESNHAALAWRTLTWLLRDSDAAMRAELRRAFDACLTPQPPSTPRSIALRHLGRLDPSEQHALDRATLDEVVRPAANALLPEPDPTVARA